MAVRSDAAPMRQLPAPSDLSATTGDRLKVCWRRDEVEARGDRTDDQHRRTLRRLEVPPHFSVTPLTG